VKTQIVQIGDGICDQDNRRIAKMPDDRHASKVHQEIARDLEVAVSFCNQNLLQIRCPHCGRIELAKRGWKAN
jgi:hypothetical protein